MADLHHVDPVEALAELDMAHAFPEQVLQMVDLLGLGLDFDGQQQSRFLGGLLLLDLVGPCARGGSWIGEVGQRGHHLPLQFLPAVHKRRGKFRAQLGDNDEAVALVDQINLDRTGAWALVRGFHRR
ncbi:hypothetical protein D3C81_575580 [compost metagenome]